MENERTRQSRALAEHLRTLRLDHGLTLQDLAQRSGVSRATLSRVENGEVSPTAETLGRLASAFALPLSRLLAPLEQRFHPLVRHAEQSLWQDRGSGYARRSLSPPSGQLKIEIIECTIEPHQTIVYDRPALPDHEHHLVLLSGTLSLTVDGVRHDISPGDCLRYRLQGSSRFQTGDEPVRYLIAMT